MEELHRIIIYPKDIQNITGKKDQAARKLYHRIRQALNKPHNGIITIDEFCNFTGVSKEEIKPFLI